MYSTQLSSGQFLAPMLLYYDSCFQTVLHLNMSTKNPLLYLTKLNHECFVDVRGISSLH